MANIFMEYFETTAWLTAEKQPKVWKRYVDDTFVIWPHGRDHLNNFLTHINSLHSSITFTLEIEEKGRLPFLDVLNWRNHNTLETRVYRKPTHTNQYLNFKSHHHPRVKFGIVQCLTKRAIAICSKHHLQEELDLLKDVFGYPEKKVNELMKYSSTNKKEVKMNDVTERND